MKLIDNVNEILKDDLKKELNRGTKLSIVAASFSIFAFKELKDELAQVSELDFIFNEDEYSGDNVAAEEADLYGSEFEARLRNDMMQQKLAKECADWIRERVHFKANISGAEMPGFINAGEKSYSEIKKFTTVDLGARKGKEIYYPIHFQADVARAVVDVFDGQPYLTPTYMMDRGDGTYQMTITEDVDYTGWSNARLIPEISDGVILEHIQEIQRANQIEPSRNLGGKYSLTIEMETGVGKTYTYIKTMYELNKQ